MLQMWLETHLSQLSISSLLNTAVEYIQLRPSLVFRVGREALLD
jgi:hypothetical protein